MKSNVFLIALLLICSTTSFSYAKEKEGNLKNVTVVAKKATVNGIDLITCDISKLDKVIDIPLSFFTEEMQIVKLDNKDEALVSGGATTITDNYILVRNNEQNPYKLFDRKGQFISNIGSYGEGPNEYLSVYDEYLDEKSKQIFLLPWQSNKILRFNFKGEPMEPIELPRRLPKGKFMVTVKKQTVLLMPLTFEGSEINPIVAWKQDFKGNIINFIKSEHLIAKRCNSKGQFGGYNNEILSNRNTNAFDCSLCAWEGESATSLYHYSDKGKLDEKFKIDFKKEPVRTHSYEELPNHFLGTLSTTGPTQLGIYEETDRKTYMVDKKTLKGSFFNLHNDFLGDLPLEDWATVNKGYTTFYNGYYVWNVEPSALIDIIEKQLKENKDMGKEDRKELTDLLNSIDENDNNYILYAKLKR